MLKSSQIRASQIEVLNVIRPGKSYVVDRTKFEAMRTAVMKVLPHREPGMTVAELGKGVLRYLPDDVFPGGATSGWWLKAVQLDLEARGQIQRAKTKPLRLYKVSH